MIGALLSPLTIYCLYQKYEDLKSTPAPETLLSLISQILGTLPVAIGPVKLVEAPVGLISPAADLAFRWAVSGTNRSRTSQVGPPNL